MVDYVAIQSRWILSFTGFSSFFFFFFSNVYSSDVAFMIFDAFLPFILENMFWKLTEGERMHSTLHAGEHQSCVLIRTKRIELFIQ